MMRDIRIRHVMQIAILILIPLGFLGERRNEQVDAGEVESRKYCNCDNHKGVGNCEIM
jgi:hypothetical protein